MEERKHLRNLHLFTKSVKNCHWQNRTFLTKKKKIIKNKIKKKKREGKERKKNPSSPTLARGPAGHLAEAARAELISRHAAKG